MMTTDNPAITKTSQAVNGTKRRYQRDILSVSRQNKYQLIEPVFTVFVKPHSRVEREKGPVMKSKSRTTSTKLFAIPLVPCRGRFGLVSKNTINHLEQMGSQTID
jgi:hypothetical protein